MWISPKSHTHTDDDKKVTWFSGIDSIPNTKGKKLFTKKILVKRVRKKKKKENEYETKQTNKRKWMKKMGIIQQTHRKNEFRWFASFFEILDSCIHVWCSYSKIVSMEYHSSIPSVRMWKPLLCVCFVLFFFVSARIHRIKREKSLPFFCSLILIHLTFFSCARSFGT